MAYIMELVSSEILEIAGEDCLGKRKIITVQSIKKGISKDT